MYDVLTQRMRLVHGTRLLAEAELEGNQQLAELLQVQVPGAWPPESLREARHSFLAMYRQASSHAEWHLGWYGVLQSDEEPVLCGSVGFKGPPTEAGVVEIGYSVLPLYQGRGIATEMVLGASRWALQQPGVHAVEAEVLEGNLASLRVRAKARFSERGSGIEPGTRRFRLTKSA
jgi:RimJ/RimL family protein N-acetyltransferase